jgi:hypothetical protein
MMAAGTVMAAAGPVAGSAQLIIAALIDIAVIVLLLNLVI